MPSRLFGRTPFFPCTILCEDIRTHLIRVLLSLSCFQESAAIVTDSCEDVSGEECEESRFAQLKWMLIVIARSFEVFSSFGLFFSIPLSTQWKIEELMWWRKLAFTKVLLQLYITVEVVAARILGYLPLQTRHSNKSSHGVCLAICISLRILSFQKGEKHERLWHDIQVKHVFFHPFEVISCFF